MHNQTTVIITRHGETEWNRQLRHQGHMDSPLTPQGILQAQALGARLKGLPIQTIYSSDLGRAMHTAQILAEAIGLPVQPESGLRETCLGISQGLTMHEFKEQYPQLHEQFLQRDPDFCLPDGESLRQFHARTITCLQTLAARHPGQTILVVSHGGNLGCIFREIFHIPFNEPRKFSLNNVSFNQFTVNSGSWRLETWGDIAHLRNLTVLDDLRTSK